MFEVLFGVYVAIAFWSPFEHEATKYGMAYLKNVRCKENPSNNLFLAIINIFFGLIFTSWAWLLVGISLIIYLAARIAPFIGGGYCFYALYQFAMNGEQIYSSIEKNHILAFSIGPFAMCVFAFLFARAFDKGAVEEFKNMGGITKVDISHTPKACPTCGKH
ncbi:hypothetical protein [Terasakiella sp. SH-1]|uniref:hypothetical protein n=1 Tax=Terasakiella sp. SH-1 TaxID=2560057 RepID=UPI001073D148|nr:hypothetical protein [Terasakiella sp. SH-1]